MEKKSTDYCFKGCKEFGEYLKDNYPNKQIGGWIEEGTVYFISNNSKLFGCGYDFSHTGSDKILISWQEFKQLFIDKTMTTQEEINELKTRLQELEEKVKKENEFKVGDLVVVLPEDAHYHNSAQGKAQEIVEVRSFVLPYVLSFADGSTNSYRLIRKATQAEIDKYLAKNKPIKISGYKAEFNKANKTVSFGCKKDITKKDLEAILTVMKLNKKFNASFIIDNEDFNCEDYDIEVSKETIQKLIDKLEE